MLRRLLLLRGLLASTLRLLNRFSLSFGLRFGFVGSLRAATLGLLLDSLFLLITLGLALGTILHSLGRCFFSSSGFGRAATLLGLGLSIIGISSGVFLGASSSRGLWFFLSGTGINGTLRFLLGGGLLATDGFGIGFGLLLLVESTVGSFSVLCDGLVLAGSRLVLG